MINKYIVGDSRNLIKNINKLKISKQPDLIITSPPYYNIKNYGNTESQIGYKQSYDEYLNDVINVFQQCYNLSTNNATFWLIIDTIKINKFTLPLPFDINSALKTTFGNETWKLNDIIIWDKCKNLPWHSKGRLKNQFEYILFFSKNNNYIYNIDDLRHITEYKKWWLTYPERYNSCGTPPSNIWSFIIPIRGWGNGYQKHLCPFPFPLIERIIKLSSDNNSLILDPFAGSGSVLALAKEMGHEAIGFDLNKEYKKKYNTEVTKGAKIYWKNRKKEIIAINNNITKFKLLNNKLRKIKAATKLIKEIKNKFGINLNLLALNNRNFKKVNYFILNDNNIKSIKMELINNCVNSLNKEFNIEIKLNMINNFSTLLNKIKVLYSYTNKIYSYDKIIKLNKNDSNIKNIFNDFNIITNIKLRLNKKSTFNDI